MIEKYKIEDEEDIDIEKIGKRKIGDKEVVILDKVEDYDELMERMLDLEEIREMIKGGLKMKLEEMNEVKGNYEKEILERRIGEKEGRVVNLVKMKDLGGNKKDKKIVYEKDI